jgi:DNA polymerase III alpha subunit
LPIRRLRLGAERTFRQLEGFGSYGFPESHAASFALIAYAACWMKWHHPDVFLAAILNAQPMDLYAPAQLVRDARTRRRGAAFDVNRSEWDCTLEHALSKIPRLDLQRIDMEVPHVDVARLDGGERRRAFDRRRSGRSLAALETR